MTEPMGLLSTLAKIAVTAVIVWLGLRWFERANLYFPDRQLIATPAQVGLPFEEIWLTVPDGVRLNAWFIPAVSTARPDAPSPTLLICHGNAGNISHRLDKAGRLRALGVSLFLFDYRGYGQSSGRPSEAGMYQDAEAAYRYLTEERKARRGPIVLYGESLGCAVAVEIAKRHPDVAGLILESAFTSTIDMAKRYFPWLPARWIVRDRYDSLVKMPLLQAPVLILHSPQDEIVPFEMAQRLWAAAREPKKLVRLAGDHNEGYIDSGVIYTKAIQDFIDGTI